MNTYLIAGGITFALVVILVLYLNLRDSPKNNFKRAKKHHKIAEELYSSERFEDADEHYLLSNHYREKAEKQLKGEN